MGEKGNIVGDPSALLAAVVEPSLVERITTTTTSTVMGVGQDFLETVKDKAVGAVADVTVAAARDRMTSRDDPGDAPAGHGDSAAAGSHDPTPAGHGDSAAAGSHGPTPAEQTGPDAPPGTTQDGDPGR